MWQAWEKREIHTKFWYKNKKGRNQLEDRFLWLLYMYMEMNLVNNFHGGNFLTGRAAGSSIRTVTQPVRA
jgi:hypothetical protein